jgi:hypothetical protein
MAFSRSHLRGAVLLATILILAGPAAADAPYATGFETDTAGLMPAGWTAVSGGPQMVVDTAARSGIHSFHQASTNDVTTEANYTWGPPIGVPWTLEFSMMIGGNTTRALGNTVRFGLFGSDTWGATGIYIGYREADDAWIVRGATDPGSEPIVQPDTWYDLRAEFNGGDRITGRVDWFINSVQFGFDANAYVEGPASYILYDTGSSTGGQAYGYVDAITATPEPATAALLALGAVPLLRRRQRARRLAP